MNDGDNVNDDDGHDDEYKPYSCLQCDLSFKMTKDLKLQLIQPYLIFVTDAQTVSVEKKSVMCATCAATQPPVLPNRKDTCWFTEANPAWL